MDEVESLHALNIEEESGNIALCDREKVYIYEPSGRDYGDLRWTRTRDLPSDEERPITYLSWGSSNELLVAGRRLALWSFADEDRPQVIWSSELSSPVSLACFSPDAGLIASCGQHDRLVKIWRRLSYEQDSTRFDVSYLSHPSTVTNLSWRKAWHQEQNLENLLYTYCADKQLHVWAHSDHHARSLMQEISAINTKESIQPRRMSMNSVSTNRFAFMIHSRDLSRAAERALQIDRQGTDHALEHLIEIANRAPEICIVLDGRGHMSAWGLENAGYKNKPTAERFNVTLVDGVDISLPEHDSIEDYVQIQAFANNDLSSSLCILVHSYSGQIDWYEGSFTHFFDTASRERRIQLHSCWSGHASAIDKMVSSQDHKQFVSWTDANRAIVWAQSTTGALVRKSRLSAETDIFDIILLSTRHIAIILSRSGIDIWNIQSLQARSIHHVDLDVDDRSRLILLSLEEFESPMINFGVVRKNLGVQKFSAYLPTQSSNANANGYHKTLSSSGDIHFHASQELDAVRSHAYAAPARVDTEAVFSVLSQTGTAQVYDGVGMLSTGHSVPTVCLDMFVQPSTLSAVCDGFLAVVHEDLETLSVWSTKQASNEFYHTFDGNDEIQGLHWYTTQDDLHLLAVQFTYAVTVLSQRRYSLDDQTTPWSIQQVIRTREHSTHAIESLCWLEPCHIVLGVGNQILTFDVLSATTQKAAKIDCAHEMTLHNSCLPIFHPRTITSLLERGQYSVVDMIFEALQDELRYAVVGDTISSDLGLDLAETIDTSKQQEHSNNIVPSNLDGEEAASRLCEGIIKISPNQLSATDRQQLCHLVRIYAQLQENRRSMDTFALTYLYHFLFAMSTKASDAPEILPLRYSAIVAAAVSKTQESLIEFILTHLDKLSIKLTWPNARSLGLFLFLNPSSPDDRPLHTQLENIAKNEYNRNSDDRNPVNCSLYYLALNKKAILQSLWRTTIGVKEKESTMKLLAHDFTQQKWKATALKNAYALLSRRRFEYAASFFLLGGSLSDACNVCVNQLHDIQLAIAIARVWDGDKSVQDEVINRLLEKTLLDVAVDSSQARWMAIWAAVHMHDHERAIQAITQPIDQLLEAHFKARRENMSDEDRIKNWPYEALSWKANEPTLLLNLYIQLRSQLLKDGKWTKGIITPQQEWAFIMRCVNWYTRAGLDWLALRLVKNWEFVEWNEEEKDVPATSIAEEDIRTVPAHQEPTSMLDAWTDDAPFSTIKDDKKKPDVKADEVKTKAKAKPAPTQFMEPSADSLLDSFGF